MTLVSDGDTRAEENKATLRRMLERLSAGDVDGFVDSLAPGYVREATGRDPHAGVT